jgi:hypothetical protein
VQIKKKVGEINLSNFWHKYFCCISNFWEPSNFSRLVKQYICGKMICVMNFNCVNVTLMGRKTKNIESMDYIRLKCRPSKPSREEHNWQKNETKTYPTWIFQILVQHLGNARDQLFQKKCSCSSIWINRIIRLSITIYRKYNPYCTQNKRNSESIW